jgi:hypothetical protein
MLHLFARIEGAQKTFLATGGDGWLNFLLFFLVGQTEKQQRRKTI